MASDAGSRAATSVGLRVVLVEDLVTTGGSSLDAVGALRDAGADRRRLPRDHDLRLRRTRRGVRGRRGAADAS